MLFRVTAQWNDAVVADSAATLEAVFSAHGYAADTATCLLSVQDLHACFEKPLLKFDTGRLSMVFVGRLAVEKNLENCLFAMDFARSQGVSLNLDVYGAGDEQFRLEAIARLRGLRDAVAFHGVRFDWLDRVSRSGAFGLLASEREGLSITALQFLALGYPLLTAAAGEIKSYVQDGVNSIIAQDTTARAIATAMVRAWDLRENWPEMAAAARRSAKQFERWSETEQRDRSFRELIRHLARDD